MSLWRCRYSPAHVKLLCPFPFPRNGSDRNYVLIGVPTFYPILQANYLDQKAKELDYVHVVFAVWHTFPSEFTDTGFSLVITTVFKLSFTVLPTLLQNLYFLQNFRLADHFFNGTTVPSGPGPLYYRGFTNVLRHSSGRVISRTQRPLPNNTQHSQETNIHPSRGIRNRNPRMRPAADPCLRPRVHWDRQLKDHAAVYCPITICAWSMVRWLVNDYFETTGKEVFVA